MPPPLVLPELKNFQTIQNSPLKESEVKQKEKPELIIHGVDHGQNTTFFSNDNDS